MLRADERGENNMSRGHGNHSAQGDVAASAGEVRREVQLHGPGRRAGGNGCLKRVAETADEGGHGGVLRADAAREVKLLQAHVPQGVARRMQKRRQGVGPFNVQLRAPPGQRLLLTQRAPVSAASGEASLKGGDARAEGRAVMQAQFPGKFHRHAADVVQQNEDRGDANGQIYTFSIVMKTFFPN